MSGRSILVALSLLFPLVGAPAAQARLSVVTTTQDLASLATLVGGNRVTAFPLAKGYQDPHGVDAKPSFTLKLASADLLVVVGLGLEAGYLPPLLVQSRNAKVHPGGVGFLDASIGCDVVRPAGPVSRAQGDIHPAGNPHYWTDPDNGLVIARALAAKFTELDPDGTEVYARNLAGFEARLAKKQREWNALMAPFAGAKIVTFHDSWPNFAKHFNLVVAGHVEPKPGIPPSPSHMLAIINLVKSSGVRVILSEPYFDQKTPKAIADRAGATALVFYPSVGGKAGIDDYFQLFDANIASLVAVLGARP